MVNKSAMQSDIRTMLDVIMVTFGVVFGGVLALATIWLWFDYQANPAHSVLSIISVQAAGFLPATLQNQIKAQTQLMGLPLTGNTSAYWYMARAGGIVAYMLMWLSVVWGLILSTKVTSKLISMPVAYGTHEFLSILAILFAIVHALVLLGDEYINFSPLHLIVPFTSPYEPLGTGLGIIGLYFTIALTASFYMRKQIGQKIWRLLHYFTFAAYLLVLSHGIMSGSDSNTLASVLLYWATGAVVLFLVYFRLFTLKSSRKRKKTVDEGRRTNVAV